MYPYQGFRREDGVDTDDTVFAEFNREFPSLSNAPQTQNQNPGQAIWANANQRAVQSNSDLRPQQQNLRQNISQQQQSQNSHRGQDTTQQTPTELFASGSQFPGRFEDYRHGGQSGVGQLSGSTQPPPSSIDEFPPLGRGAPNDNGLDRRGSMIRNAAFDGFANASSYPGSSDHTRSQNIGSGQNTSAPDGARATNLIDRVLSPGARPFAATTSRISGDVGRPAPDNIVDFRNDGVSGTRSNSHSSNTLFSNLQDSSVISSHGLPTMQSNSQNQPSSYGGNEPPHEGPPTATGSVASLRPSHTQSSAATPEQAPAQMSEMDRWGLSSLLAIMKGENSDATGLAVGQDLTQLGLNLNSPEYALTKLICANRADLRQTTASDICRTLCRTRLTASPTRLYAPRMLHRG